MPRLPLDGASIARRRSVDWCSGQLGKLQVKGFAFLLGSILTACVPAAAEDVAPTQLDTIARRAQACTPCHGKEGRAAVDGYYPRIAGKPAEYLFNQLLNFRDGRRFFPMMNYLADRQRENYLRELAEYFASQQLPYAAPTPAKVGSAVLNRGRQLVTDGDRSLDLPACSACHGTNLLGVMPAVPGLLGVSQYYLDAQMAAWKNGTRHAKAPDCMAQIARRLSPADLGAVTAWLASQVVPDNALPEQQSARSPPMQCGSMQTSSAANVSPAP
jgi:cytochrome c553